MATLPATPTLPVFIEQADGIYETTIDEIKVQLLRRKGPHILNGYTMVIDGEPLAQVFFTIIEAQGKVTHLVRTRWYEDDDE